MIVDGAGNQLLAAARFAGDQHSSVGAGQTGGFANRLEKRRAATDEREIAQKFFCLLVLIGGFLPNQTKQPAGAQHQLTLARRAIEKVVHRSNKSVQVPHVKSSALAEDQNNQRPVPALLTTHYQLLAAGIGWESDKYDIGDK